MTETDARYVLRYGNIRDGRIYGPLPASSASGSQGMRGEGSVSIEVPGNDRAAGVYRALPPGKGMWVLEWNDGLSRRVVDAGTLWNRPVGDTSMSLSGAGMFALLNARLLRPDVPVAALAGSVLTYSNLDLGSIMAAIVGQVQSLSDGDLPIVLQAARTGTRTRTYQGFDMAMAGQRITELADVEPNTEFLLMPRFVTGSTTRVVWDFLTGTEANPQLTNLVPWRLNRTTPGQKVVGEISVEDTATGMATTAWAVGAGEERAKVLRSATDATLTSGGWPRLDVVETNDSTDSAVVQSYANGVLAKTRRPARAVSVQVSAAWWWRTGGRVGDKVHLTADHLVLGRLDFTSRVTQVGWDIASAWVGLTLADSLAEEGF